jgi:hypothetical protein
MFSSASYQTLRRAQLAFIHCARQKSRCKVGLLRDELLPVSAPLGSLPSLQRGPCSIQLFFMINCATAFNPHSIVQSGGTTLRAAFLDSTFFHEPFVAPMTWAVRQLVTERISEQPRG